MQGSRPSLPAHWVMPLAMVRLVKAGLIMVALLLLAASAQTREQAASKTKPQETSPDAVVADCARQAKDRNVPPEEMGGFIKSCLRSKAQADAQPGH